MSDMISGGCLCGNVRFETTSEPAMQVLCHCVDCQTVSGSAFYTAYIVQLESVKLTKGEPGSFTVKSDRDGATIVAFAEIAARGFGRNLRWALRALTAWRLMISLILNRLTITGSKLHLIGAF